MAFIWCYCVQENRREYEKRVASIVEQSWLIFGDEAEAKEATKGDWAPLWIYTHNSYNQILEGLP